MTGMYSSEDEEYIPNYLNLSSPFLDEEDVDKENVPSGSSIGTPSSSQANVPSSSRINKNIFCKRRTVTESFPPVCEQPATTSTSSTSSTGFILDALGLYRDQLLRTPDEHKRNPNKWWLHLAENDDAREKLFHILSEKRVTWSGKARIAIGRALEDIRRYHFDPDRSMLLPSKKKRVMVEGSSVTGEEETIQKTENVEDEVEVVVEN